MSVIVRRDAGGHLGVPTGPDDLTLSGDARQRVVHAAHGLDVLAHVCPQFFQRSDPSAAMVKRAAP